MITVWVGRNGAWKNTARNNLIDKNARENVLSGANLFGANLFGAGLSDARLYGYELVKED